ncbi:unnamed protein product [Fusarium graminearum]|nr:unnamed protein product [Fusarium graminearum]
MSRLNGTVNTISLYISLDSRPSKGEYGESTVHHASNRDGPWRYDAEFVDPTNSMTLIAMIKVSDIRSPDLVEHAIRSVPANGNLSGRNGDGFTCRTWVKDALVSLHDSGAIVLPTDIAPNMKLGTLTVFCGLVNALPSSNYLNWKTFKANGVNIGGWLHQEAVIDPRWWNQYAPGTPDEWDFCAKLGSRCGIILEQRYSSFITTKDIDAMAKAGINVIRIPTGYNAWVTVPGSQLYSGNQARFLRVISDYAIKKHGIHVILDIHSLPGGLNGMGLGEKEGNYGWFQNQTALDYSYKAVDAAIKFIQESDVPQGFTLAPINEPVDNRDITKFGTPEALSDQGAAWVLRYFQGVVSRVQKINPKIPILLQGGFRPVEFWAKNFTANTNIVFDVHHYYFAGRPATSQNLPEFICTDAKASAEPKFPVFVGEWSIQATSDNSFSSRAINLNTGLKSWSKYTRGSAYWTWKFFGNVPVDGEGTQGDYWNYSEFVKMAIINPSTGISCK